MPVIPDRARTLAAFRFRALGDETRLAILELLVGGERAVADLMEVTGLGQSLVSHHLRSLRECGLVSTRREGRWIRYSIVPDAVDATIRILAEYQ